MIRLRQGRRSWRATSFGVLDFETTGLDLERDHVLSYGLVPVEHGRVRMEGALYRLVRPPVPVAAESIRVHRIRPEELEDAPSLGEIASELIGALEGRILVAYAAGIELAFLGRLYDQRGRHATRRAIDVIDLAAQDRARVPLRALRLPELATSYGVPVARTHHALGDALTTAQLFLVLATRLEAVGRGDLSSLLRAGRPQFARSSLLRPLDRPRPLS